MYDLGSNIAQMFELELVCLVQKMIGCNILVVGVPGFKLITYSLLDYVKYGIL